MNHVKQIMTSIDLFIAPSRYLMERFIDDFYMDLSKIVYLDYGFRRHYLKDRKRKKEGPFTFGYIGTHKQAKGIFHLLQAFHQVHEDSELKIWGSPLQPFTSSLKSYVSALDAKVQRKIQWMSGYRNSKIVEDVFNQVDAIVVPSIWGENSPLVIHEALEAKVPIITADFGGMKEYIQHGVNGLLFDHRDPTSLAGQMEQLKSDSKLLDRISKRGYLQSYDGRIPGIEEHVRQLESYYRLVIKRRKQKNGSKTRTLAHYI